MFSLNKANKRIAIISFSEEIRLTGKKSIEMKEWFKKQNIVDYETVIIDCDNVVFIDSMGIASIISMYKMIESSGKKMILSSLRKEVKEILTLLKLDKLFSLDDRSPEEIIKEI
ncbi:MAG: STAS domain-containing protein [Kosmotogaceae bacterium]